MPRYRVYGVNVESSTPLCLPPASESDAPTVTLTHATAEWFVEALQGAPLVEVSPNWYKMAHTPDGATYVRWEDWFHFLIESDGRRIAHALLSPARTESFHAYLLSQALSFALIRIGREPLHASCIAIEDKAVAFMGPSGLGKSTLTACFLKAGAKLLTDDLLVMSPETGLAEPGPHRIKLFPEVAEQLIESATIGVSINPASTKRIIPLAAEKCCAHPVPVAALYALRTPTDEESDTSARIERLSARDAFLELLRGTFNSRIRTPQRLKQQFASYSHLARKVPVKRLTYTRELSNIFDVRDLVLHDLKS